MEANAAGAQRRYLWILLAVGAVAAVIVVVLIGAPDHPAAVRTPPTSTSASAGASASPAGPPAVAAPACPPTLDLAWWPQMQASGQRPVPYAPTAGIACRYPGRATPNDGGLVGAVPLSRAQLMQLQTMLNQLREPGKVFACPVNPQWTDVLVLARPEGPADPIYGQLDTISINLGGCDVTSSRLPGLWEWSPQLRRYLDALFGSAGVA